MEWKQGSSLTTSTKYNNIYEFYSRAQAEGIQSIYEACGRDTKLTQFYLGLEKNLYPELGDKMADAMQGLNPKINIWNTGSTSMIV